MGRHREYPLTDTLLNNLGTLICALNKVRVAYGKPMIVSSGYRPGKYNKAAGGAQNSCHLTLEACDFADSDRSLTNFLLSNQKVLRDAGLRMEDPGSATTWVHLQTRMTNELIFKP